MMMPPGANFMCPTASSLTTVALFAFLIADGVLPGNEGRSYVLRLILRRAARFGRLLLACPFLAETAQAVIDTMGDHYSELRQRADLIRDAIT